MTPQSFRASLSENAPPGDMDLPLVALWWDAKHEWERAHAAVADETSLAAAWVHAYLHRKEGDLGNARYWYRIAKRPVGEGPLDAEWDAILSGLLP